MSVRDAGARAIVLIADGLGDRPAAELDGQTPLEFAHTPTLDALCARGCAGLIHPYRPGARVGTDWGHLCLFGYDPAGFYTGRGAVEAAAAGLELKEGDVAFRGNFAAVEEDWTVTDRRAGRIREAGEIARLVEAVDGLLVEDCEFRLRPLTEHRLALVMRGPGLYGAVPDTDPGTAREGSRVGDPRDGCEERANKTARLLWAYLQQVHRMWRDHPVNRERIARGHLPANMILTRGSALAMTPPPIRSHFPGLRGAVVAGDATVLGIGRMCGLEPYTRAGFTGGMDSDYTGKAELALELLERHTAVFVHVKATDLCGHDNLPREKAGIIERIDGMFRLWAARADPTRTYLAMTADHSTPCHSREHSADPVPSFLCGPHLRRDGVSRFGERSCAGGGINNYTGAALTATLMDYLDHNKKLGA